MASKQIFCFGMGFSARVLGNSLSEKGWIVSGTTRNGVGDTVIFDSSRPLSDPSSTLLNASHILLSIPPNEEGDPVFIFPQLAFTVIEKVVGLMRQHLSRLRTAGVNIAS